MGVATDTSAAFGNPTDNFGRPAKGRLMERDGPPVQVTAIDAGGIITLSDPTRRNARSLEMRDVLQPATEELLNHARIRSLVGPNEGSAALIFRRADAGAAGKGSRSPRRRLSECRLQGRRLRVLGKARALLRPNARRLARFRCGCSKEYL
jgi:hypothetical protein